VSRSSRDRGHGRRFLAESDANILSSDQHSTDPEGGTFFFVAELEQLGREIERIVLARAVTWHVDDRVLGHENNRRLLVEASAETRPPARKGLNVVFISRQPGHANPTVTLSTYAHR
jgi:hypothetical protein